MCSCKPELPRQSTVLLTDENPTFYAVLITIHTWAHLGLATHMKASCVNDQQVALTTLKLRAHTCLIGHGIIYGPFHGHPKRR